MLRIQTVVLATDGSPAAEAARPAAQALADRHRAALHVLRVELVPPVLRSGPPPHAQDRVDGSTVEAVRPAPTAGSGIVNYIDEVSADVVVVGTHGHTGFRRTVLGSVAEDVLRRAPCAVLTVGPEATLAAEGPLLAPLAFESASDAALQTAAALAEARGTALVALHVLEPIEIPAPYGMTVAPFDVASLEASVRETLERWTGGVTDVPLAVEVRHGRAEHEILDCAAEHQASLIVQSTAGRRGLGRWILGSVAESVARRAACPVLTLRAGARSLLRRDPDATMLPVPRADWRELFDALSGHAQAAPHTVTVDVLSPTAEGRVLDGVPLLGLTYDPHDDAVEVLTAHGGHHALRPFSIRTTAGPWSVDAALDPDAPGPWVLDVVRADGTRERIGVRAADAVSA